WRRERFWLEEPASRGDARSVVRDGVARPAHPLLAQYVAPSDQSGTHVWESTIDVSSFPYLRDHSVHGSLIAPGMLWVAMALAAGAELYDERFDGLAEVSFEKVLELTG